MFGVGVRGQYTLLNNTSSRIIFTILSLSTTVSKNMDVCYMSQHTDANLFGVKVLEHMKGILI